MVSQCREQMFFCFRKSPSTTSTFSSYIHEEQQSELRLCVQVKETDVCGGQEEKLFNLQKPGIYPLTCTYGINTVCVLVVFSPHFSFPHILYRILYTEIVSPDTFSSLSVFTCSFLVATVIAVITERPALAYLKIN